MTKKDEKTLTDDEMVEAIEAICIHVPDDAGHDVPRRSLADAAEWFKRNGRGPRSDA
jgi:hypothetical protein